MCNFWTCILTRDGAVVWDPNTSSHEELIKKAGLKDSELEDRDFVRLELSPKTPEALWRKSSSHLGWRLKVDEEKTLPEWFTAKRKEMCSKAWEAWKQAMQETLWKLRIERLPSLVDEIKAIKYFSMNSEPNPEWHMSYGKTWDAARVAAGVAARVAARDAAGDAAWVAAGVAALYARIAILPQDAKIDQKHVEHANARLEVWRKGYGLLCDVNGKLYAYGVKEEEVKA